MSASQISTSVTIIDSLLGFQAVSLTAMGTASAPTIAAGSKIEVAGAFFSWASAETPQATTWTAISTGGTAYLTVTPSGTAGAQVLTAKWSSTEPVWSTSKQGWYASAGSTIRYIGGCAKTAGSEYSNKFITDSKNWSSSSDMLYDVGGTVVSAIQTHSIYVQLGEWNMVTTSRLTITLSGAETITNNIVELGVVVQADPGVSGMYRMGCDSVDSVSAGSVTVGSWYWAGDAQLVIRRGEWFNTSNFDATVSTVANRGYAFIKYAQL